MQFYQVPPADILVVLDDLALPCGQIRLRGEGSSGGHNGLKDIERALGTNQYPRLRLGIDPVPGRIPGRDYVLQRFTDEQRTRLDPAIWRSTDCIAAWADKGLSAAMNQFNQKDVINPVSDVPKQ
jgi:PTH1 family peptidyl-tRNA hydrolase